MEDHTLVDGGIDHEPGDGRIELTATTLAEASETAGEDRSSKPNRPSPDRRSWFNGLLRWKYIIPRVLLVALVWGFFTYGFDPTVRYGIVTLGEMIIGAKVDVETVHTKLYPPEFTLKSVGITDPRRTDENAATFEELHVRMAGEPLLYREYVIEEATLKGIRVNADRLRDGQLDVEEADDDGDGLNLDPLKKQLELIGLQWYDALEATAKKELDPKSLETVQVADAVEDEWKRRFDDVQRRIDDLQQRIDAVKEASRVKGDPLNRLDAYTRATSEVQAILQQTQRVRVDVRTLPAIARQDVVRLDEARKRDTARLKAKVKAMPLNPEEITKSLLGPELAARLQTVNRWIAWSRKYFSADAVTSSVPETRGKWIVFPRGWDNPTFVLKRLTISGEATTDGQPYAITGFVNDISSDPKLYAKPTEWRFEMAGPDPIVIVGHSDLSGEVGVHEIAFNWKTDRPVERQVGKPDKLAVVMTAGSAKCDGWLRLVGNEIESEIHLRQTPMAVTVAPTSEEFAHRWIAPALSSVRTADATLALSGTYDDIDWQVQSDVGQQVAAGFQQLLVGEIDTQRAQLLAKVDAVAQEKMSKLPTLVDQHARFLLADLTSRESRAKQAIAKLTDGKLDMNKLNDVREKFGIKKVSEKVDFGKFFRR